MAGQAKKAFLDLAKDIYKDIVVEGIAHETELDDGNDDANHDDGSVMQVGGDDGSADGEEEDESQMQISDFDEDDIPEALTSEPTAQGQKRLRVENDGGDQNCNRDESAMQQEVIGGNRPGKRQSLMWEIGQEIVHGTMPNAGAHVQPPLTGSSAAGLLTPPEDPALMPQAQVGTLPEDDPPSVLAGPGPSSSGAGASASQTPLQSPPQAAAPEQDTALPLAQTAPDAGPTTPPPPPVTRSDQDGVSLVTPPTVLNPGTRRYTGIGSEEGDGTPSPSTPSEPDTDRLQTAGRDAAGGLGAPQVPSFVTPSDHDGAPLVPSSSERGTGDPVLVTKLAARSGAGDDQGSRSAGGPPGSASAEGLKPQPVLLGRDDIPTVQGGSDMLGQHRVRGRARKSCIGSASHKVCRKATTESEREVHRHHDFLVSALATLGDNGCFRLIDGRLGFRGEHGFRAVSDAEGSGQGYRPDIVIDPKEEDEQAQSPTLVLEVKSRQDRERSLHQTGRYIVSRMKEDGLLDNNFTVDERFDKGGNLGILYTEQVCMFVRDNGDLLVSELMIERCIYQRHRVPIDFFRVKITDKEAGHCTVYLLDSNSRNGGDKAVEVGSTSTADMGESWTEWKYWGLGDGAHLPTES